MGIFVCISSLLLLTGGLLRSKDSFSYVQNVYEVLRNIGNERVKRMDGLKRVITTMALCLTAVFAYSQVWTAQDSLHLKKLLESDQELHLNMDAVKSIDFGSAVGTPRMSEEKSWMMPDESLPEALPKPKVMLTLMPYKANTRYNWDPIYQKKIKIFFLVIVKNDSEPMKIGDESNLSDLRYVSKEEIKDIKLYPNIKEQLLKILNNEQMSSYLGLLWDN